jgi:carbonic anhydrase/acetyltransferase-like protein (isoleucine patch superfamily)
MTIRALGDRIPQVDDGAWVSEAAYVVGNVTVGAGSTIWPGAVLRGDFGWIRVGRRVHIEDNCVLHSGADMIVGDDVTVGHGAIVHCGSVGDACLIGNRAVLLDGAQIGPFCMIAAGAVVLPGTTIPEGSFVTGMPGTVRPLSAKHASVLERQREAGVSGGGYSAMAEHYRAAGL